MCQSDECGPGRRDVLAGAVAAGAFALIPSAARAAGAELRVPTPVGPINAYMARPAGRGRHPGVVVMHGQFALPGWTCRVADELAAAGFVGLALSRFSRTPELTEAQMWEDGRGARRLLTETYFREQQQEVLGAVAWLRNRPFVRRGPVGAVGFCGGGINAVRLSLRPFPFTARQPCRRNTSIRPIPSSIWSTSRRRCARPCRSITGRTIMRCPPRPWNGSRACSARLGRRSRCSPTTARSTASTTAPMRAPRIWRRPPWRAAATLRSCGRG